MSKKKPESQGAAGEAPGFEKALERLETIVKEMEGGQLSLEQMMAAFEEGQALVKWCSQKLNEVEHQIEVLVKEGDQWVAKPFEDAAGEEGAEAEAEGPGPETKPDVLF